MLTQAFRPDLPPQIPLHSPWPPSGCWPPASSQFPPSRCWSWPWPCKLPSCSLAGRVPGSLGRARKRFFFFCSFPVSGGRKYDSHLPSYWFSQILSEFSAFKTCSLSFGYSWPTASKIVNWQFKWRNTARNVTVCVKRNVLYLTLHLNSSLLWVHKSTCNVFIAVWIPTLNYTEQNWLSDGFALPRCHVVYFYTCLLILEIARHTTFALMSVFLERTRASLWGSETGDQPECGDGGRADFASTRDECKIFFMCLCTCLRVYEFISSLPHKSLPSWML